MRVMNLAAGVAAVAMIALASCTPSKAPDSGDTLQYTENARIAYQQAMQAFFDKDWEAATEQFKEIRRKYGQSRYGRLSELRLADIAFEQDKLAEAVGAYKGFVQGHRNDPDIGYAQYRVCKALFMQVSDTLLLPPQEERDQGNVREAYVELRRFRKEQPQSKHTPEIAYMLEAVTGRLVRHELYVARFYLNEDKFDAAVGRVQYALRNFDGSGLEPEAIVLLGETYLKMKKNQEAREAFRRVIAVWPDSPFSTPARGFLQHMDATGR